jgi:hypothetical protein
VSVRCPRCRGNLLPLYPGDPLGCLQCGYVAYQDLDTAYELADNARQPNREQKRREGTHKWERVNNK